MSASLAIFFDASNDLWVTDGTTQGTFEISSSSNPNFLNTIYPDTAVFNGTSLIYIGLEGYTYSLGGKFQIYTTNGTINGTSSITINSDLSFDELGPEFAPVGNKELFLSTVTQETGVPATVSFVLTDGTNAGTTTFTVTAPPLGYSLDPGPFYSLGSRVIFSGSGLNGVSTLWSSNGTSAGTAPLVVNGASSAGLNASYFTVAGNKAYFNGEDSNGSLGLWVTDGTAAGTIELSPGSDPLRATAFGNGALFDISGGGLGITDGTVAGTHVLSFAAGGIGVVGSIATIGSQAVFIDQDVSTGNFALFVTNGTSAGTHEIVGTENINYLVNGYLTTFTTFGNEAAFLATDTSGAVGLWVTDGTSSGTHEITIPNAYSRGAFSFGNANLSAVGNHLVFNGKDLLGNPALWVTDGTTAGTSEIANNTAFVSISDLTSVPSSASASSPTVTSQTASQSWKVGQTVSLQLPANTFTDPQGQPLTYSATQSNGSALPSWLNFTTSTDTFSGTVPTSAANLSLTVTATDTSGLAVSETFVVTVAAPNSVAAAISAFDAGQISSSIPVQDIALTVQQNLDTLQSIAEAGKLGSITLTDSGIPNLSITATQLSADSSAINDIAGNFTLTVAAGTSAVNITGPTGHATTVAFSGNASQYTETSANGTLTITGGGVTDHLTNVAAIQFGDYSEIVAATPGPASAVTTGNITELYAAVLAREPDVGGLAFYQTFLQKNPTTPLQQFADYFLSSTEYTSNSAHNYAQSSAGDTQFIEDSYQNLLHRTPSAAEVSFYVTNVMNVAEAGLTPGTQAFANAQFQAHAQMLVYFSASAEFLSDVQVTASNPVSAQHWLVLV